MQGLLVMNAPEAMTRIPRGEAPGVCVRQLSSLMLAQWEVSPLHFLLSGANNETRDDQEEADQLKAKRSARSPRGVDSLMPVSH